MTIRPKSLRSNRGVQSRAGWGRADLRLFAALATGKLAGRLSRWLRRGDGTSLPGLIARRIDPRVLAKVVHDQGTPVIVVTGSNGKTTTSRMLTALLRAEGVAARSNWSGANLEQGVTTLAVDAADFRGRISAAVLVTEVDEGALRRVVPELAPKAVLALDLFRDQLDRYGELHAVSDALEAIARALPPDAAWIVNADDPLVAFLAPERTERRVTFGLDLDRSTDGITSAADSIRCPRCRAGLVYDRVYLSHLGDYACPACGLSRPRLDVAVTALELTGIAETNLTVRVPTGELVLRIPQAGVHVAYDAAAALAVMVGLGIAPDHAEAALADVKPAFGRLEVAQVGDRRIVLGFVKNPTSYNTTLHALAGADEPRQLLIAASNTPVDGEDFAWLWDVDFGPAAGLLERVTVSGTRADELANRLKYAGVGSHSIAVVADRRRAFETALAGTLPGRQLTILAGYTPMLELRALMHERGWVGRLRDA